MYKIQRLQNHLIASGVISKDRISVFVDKGKQDWVFSPNDNSYSLSYTANLLIRDYNSKQLPLHLLFFTLASFLDEKDATRTGKSPIFSTGILDKDETDLEIILNFTEEYVYERVSNEDLADLSVNNLYAEGELVHLKLVPQEDSDNIASKGRLITLHKIQDHEHDL